MSHFGHITTTIAAHFVFCCSLPAWVSHWTDSAQLLMRRGFERDAWSCKLDEQADVVTRDSVLVTNRRQRQHVFTGIQLHRLILLKKNMLVSFADYFHRRWTPFYLVTFSTQLLVWIYIIENKQELSRLSMNMLIFFSNVLCKCLWHLLRQSFEESMFLRFWAVHLYISKQFHFL